MPVTAETLRLQAELRAGLEQVTDGQTRVLVAAWVDAWNEVSPDLHAALLEQLVAGERVTRAQLLRSTRLRKALELIAARLEDLAKVAGVTVTGDLQRVVDTAGGAQASVIDSQLPADTDLVDVDAWSRVDARQVEAIVVRSTEQITALTRPLSGEAYDAVRKELIRGVAAGSNPRATAARMVARAEGRFNGGLTRALNIARTETLDAYRAAADLGMRQHTDVLRGWEWLAKLDGRTCPSCWAQHGSVHALDEAGPLDHQQGRCARNPLAKSWAQLGFAGIEEPASETPDAEAVFDALPSTEQLQILGPARFEAWRTGDFPMGSWSQLRRTDGWRDSYGVASPPNRSGGRRSRVAA